MAPKPDPMRGTKRPDVIAKRKAAFAKKNQADVVKQAATKETPSFAPGERLPNRKLLLARKFFHEEAFRTWVREKISFWELGRRYGVHESTICLWAKKEGWAKLLKDIAERAKGKVVRTEADRLASMSSRQQKIARAAQRKVWDLLQSGTIMIDPMTGKYYVEVKEDGRLGAERREMQPGELNQAIQAFQRAADLEYARAGGLLAPAGALDVRFPDLVALLEKLWKAREGKTIDGKVIESKPVPLSIGSDPREGDA